MLISGIVVSARDYALHNVWTEALDESDRKSDPSDTALTSDGFIHLKEAFFFLPGHASLPTKGDGVYWRGRLDRVDGFFFGTIRNE
jgi:hypothetical protein